MVVAVTLVVACDVVSTTATTVRALGRSRRAGTVAGRIRGPRATGHWSPSTPEATLVDRGPVAHAPVTTPNSALEGAADDAP